MIHSCILQFGFGSVGTHGKAVQLYKGSIMHWNFFFPFIIIWWLIQKIYEIFMCREFLSQTKVNALCCCWLIREGTS